MNRAIYPASAFQGRIGCIYNGVHRNAGDIAEFETQHNVMVKCAD